MHFLEFLLLLPRKTLELNKNNRKSLSLDLYSQYKDFEDSNQFRFTPPPQVVNSLNESIIELLEEGGVEKDIMTT